MIESREERRMCHVARKEKDECMWDVFGKRHLERSIRRWENDTVMGLRDMGWGGMDMIHLTQDRGQWKSFVSTEMKLHFS
jgi:hypothetical protein